MMLDFLCHPALLLFHLFSLSLIAFVVLGVVKVLTGTWATRVGNYPPGNRGIPWIGETLAFMAANNSSKGFYDFVSTRHIRISPQIGEIRRELRLPTPWNKVSLGSQLYHELKDLNPRPQVYRPLPSFSGSFFSCPFCRYGNCFKTSILGETHVFVSSVEAAKAILSCDAIDFSKRYIRSIAELLGDQSLLCASHEQHKLTRRRISNLFTLDSMASSINMFDELTIKTLCSWKQKGNVVVFDEALKVTFTAICKMLISLEEEDKLEMLRKDVFEVSEAMLAFPLKLLGTRYYRGVKARKRINNTLRKIIASRRKGLEHHEDFLQCLLVRDESLHDCLWTDTQILDNILTLIIAGQITTASAIAWMVKYLDENQEVQKTLRALHLDLALKLSHFPLGLEALNEMPYACKIVKESLRMATIVSWFPRVALKDRQIGGFQIRKGWIVNVDARSIHYDPAVYDDPVKFDPSRFDEDPKPYSFLAFGMGGRTCLGMNLAKAMMLVFLHRLVITFRWKVTDPDSSLEKWALFPRLRSGCPIHVIG